MKSHLQTAHLQTAHLQTAHVRTRRLGVRHVAAQIEPWHSSRRLLAVSALLVLLAVTLVESAAAADLRGRVILAKNAGGKPSREVRNAQIYFTPRTPIALEVPAEPFEIVTVRKEFTPRALTVPVGSTVQFPNEDVILHNVFSVSGKNRFDLGLYKRGAGKQATFEHPGVVRIFCNVHHSMVAYIIVVETPFHATPNFDGQFFLSGLPEGPGTLTVWHERSEPYTRELTLPLAEPLEIQLTVSKPRVPRHTNKFGKPYARKRSGRAY